MALYSSHIESQKYYCAHLQTPENLRDQKLQCPIADIVSKQFGSDIPSRRDLVNLPNYEMYLNMMVDGVQTQPFSAQTILSKLLTVTAK
jgi:hypothetical protein